MLQEQAEQIKCGSGFAYRRLLDERNPAWVPEDPARVQRRAVFGSIQPSTEGMRAYACSVNRAAWLYMRSAVAELSAMCGIL